MSKKKGGFQSLSDAGDLLKKAFGQGHEPARQPPKGRGVAQPEKPAVAPFEDIERKMLKASEAPRTETAAKQRHIENGRAHAKARGKSGKGKASKVFLKAPGLKEAFRKHLEDEQRAKEERERPEATQSFLDPNLRRQESYRRIREIVGTCSPTIEARPQAVSRETTTRVVQAVARGARAFAAAPDRDVDGFIVGFDFGTSSLKLAVRQPYRAGENLAVLPVPTELRSGGHTYLWQTALWFDPVDQSFSLFPKPGLEVLEGFKTGIIGGHGGQRVRADVPVTRSEAAIVFVAMQIAHFLGWYAEERPLKEAGADRFLSINIGIPVAAQDDFTTFTTFRRIVAAARGLVPYADRLTLADARKAYQNASVVLPDGWEIIPELTAAIAGYAADPTSQSGSHVLIDVGASTLDIVAFNLLRNERVAVISAGVELLGSASLEAACGNGVSEEDFQSACDRQFSEVFGDACKRSRGSTGFSSVLRSRDVQLITTGGGCASPLHGQFIKRKNIPAVLGSLPVVRPQPPASCTSMDCDRSRLLLAYGLTRDVPELLELKLPSQVPDIRVRHAPEPFFPSAEVT